MIFSDIINKALAHNIKCVPSGVNQYTLSRNNMKMTFDVYKRSMVNFIHYKNSHGVNKKFDNINDVIKFMNGNESYVKKIEFKTGFITIVNDSMEIKFNDKPDEETRSMLKGIGLKWFHKREVWSHYSATLTKYDFKLISDYLLTI
jgi:hypothetical protein